MRNMLMIESGAKGVLWVNGQFCGPMEEEGQAFPCAANAEITIQHFPFGENPPLTAYMQLRSGRLALLEPRESCYALLWPDGMIQLELKLREESADRLEREETAPNVLLRYLNMRLTGDAQARLLLMQAEQEIDLSAYHAAVPLRFAPLTASDRHDLRAGLVRRIAPNIACVDAALAMTVPAGQGRRLIERIEIMKT